MYFLVFLSLQFCIKKRFFSYLYTDCTIPMILYPYYNFNVRWSCGGLVNISSVFLFFSLDFTLISLSVSVLSDRGFHRDYSQEEGGFCPCLILTNSHTFSYRCLITHSQESTLFNIHSLTQRVYTLCYHSVSFVPRVE